MKTRATTGALFLALTLLATLPAIAHPTGNLIVAGNHVLWPYISPINDPGHYACVMIWIEGSEPEILIQSEHPASDFMLYANQQDIYLIERRFVQTRDAFEVRC